MVAFGRIFIGVMVLCLGAYFYAQIRTGGPVDDAIENAVQSVEDAADIDLDDGTLEDEAEPEPEEPDPADAKANRLDSRWRQDEAAE